MLQTVPQEEQLMPDPANHARPQSKKLRRRHHKTVFSRSVDWELQGGIALRADFNDLAEPDSPPATSSSRASNQAEPDSPPATPSTEPRSKVEMFMLLSPEELTQVRQDLTGDPVRARTPPRRAGTPPPRRGTRADAAGAGTQTSPAGRGATPWNACCARPADSGARREPAQRDSLARSPAQGRRASLQSAGAPMRMQGAGAPMPGLQQRMTQSCDWESSRGVRDREFGRDSARVASRDPNILRDASSVLQEMAEAMRDIYTVEAAAAKRRTK